jgi:hypothetical protein
MSRHEPIVRIALLLLVAACGEDVVEPERAQVALIPAPANELDLLFVLDDSTALDNLTAFQRAFPAFLDELGTTPDLHLGVVTSDLGTKGFDDAAPGPSIGSGPGSCSGEGKAGRLINNSTLVQGTFISDLAAADGSRITNYSSSLSEAFKAISSVGAGGCGIEQPLEAMRTALADSTGYNTGFIRPTARLAIVALQDEDDCSFAHSTLLGTDVATLGPLQSFRCTRFGVMCDEGGLTSDDMNVPGEKHQCHSREDSPYLPSVERYRAFLESFKPDAREILFATIAGVPEPVTVELRTPPGGGTAVPALAHSCNWQGTNGTVVADPAVRMAELVAAVPRGTFQPLCNLDDVGDATARSLARHVRTLLGDTCIAVPITMPADCVAFDESTDGIAANLPACPGASATTRDCFEVVADSACSGSGLRAVVHRASPPPAGTMVSLRCAL